MTTAPPPPRWRGRRGSRARPACRDGRRPDDHARKERSLRASPALPLPRRTTPAPEQEVAVRDAMRSVLAALACHTPVPVAVPAGPHEGVVPLGDGAFLRLGVPSSVRPGGEVS